MIGVMKAQFLKDMNTRDVKKITIASGCVNDFERLVSICSSKEEVDSCKKALLRYIRDYQDSRFKE